jgi:hypothetical protein
MNSQSDLEEENQTLKDLQRSIGAAKDNIEKDLVKCSIALMEAEKKNFNDSLYGSYIPVPDDPVDKRLADYLNIHQYKMHLISLFFRESEGNYIFGTRRVYIKIE